MPPPIYNLIHFNRIRKATGWGLFHLFEVISNRFSNRGSAGISFDQQDTYVKAQRCRIVQWLQCEFWSCLEGDNNGTRQIVRDIVGIFGGPDVRIHCSLI